MAPSDARQLIAVPAVQWTAPFDAFILAGGASSRMGFDKAFAEIADVSVISRVAAACSGAQRLMVVGGDEGQMQEYGLRWLPDGFPGEGPLGGIITALEHSELDNVVVVSCDLPHVDASVLDRLVRDRQQTNAHFASPVCGERVQWTTTCWARAVALDTFRTAFAAGERSIRRAARPLRGAYVSGIDPALLTDIDTPEQLARLRSTT